MVGGRIGHRRPVSVCTGGQGPFLPNRVLYQTEQVLRSFLGFTDTADGGAGATLHQIERLKGRVSRERPVIVPASFNSCRQGSARFRSVTTETEKV
jgi:hypothetical protein